MESDLVQSKNIEPNSSKLLQQRILNAIAGDKSYQVNDLVLELQQIYGTSLSIEDIRDALEKLEAQKRIILFDPDTQSDFLHYIIRSYEGVLFWLTAAAT